MALPGRNRVLHQMEGYISTCAVRRLAGMSLGTRLDYMYHNISAASVNTKLNVAKCIHKLTKVSMKLRAGGCILYMIGLFILGGYIH